VIDFVNGARSLNDGDDHQDDDACDDAVQADTRQTRTPVLVGGAFQRIAGRSIWIKSVTQIQCIGNLSSVWKRSRMFTDLGLKEEIARVDVDASDPTRGDGFLQF